MNKFLYWTPRILGILFILFLMVFSLDVFNEGLNFWQTISAFFMHNIPVLVLLISLIIFWKLEILTGIIFIIVGIFFIESLIVAVPAFITGVLFILNWSKQRSKKK